MKHISFLKALYQHVRGYRPAKTELSRQLSSGVFTDDTLELFPRAAGLRKKAVKAGFGQTLSYDNQRVITHILWAALHHGVRVTVKDLSSLRSALEEKPRLKQILFVPPRFIPCFPKNLRGLTQEVITQGNNPGTALKPGLNVLSTALSTGWVVYDADISVNIFGVQNLNTIAQCLARVRPQGLNIKG